MLQLPGLLEGQNYAKFFVKAPHQAQRTRLTRGGTRRRGREAFRHVLLIVVLPLLCSVER
jgi:hypothetical protein